MILQMSRSGGKQKNKNTPNTEVSSDKELESKIDLVRSVTDWRTREDIIRVLDETNGDATRAISYILDGMICCYSCFYP